MHLLIGSFTPRLLVRAWRSIGHNTYGPELTSSNSQAAPSPAPKVPVPPTSAYSGNITRTHRTDSVPQTPSRSARFAASQTNRDESPSPYHSKVETPTITRISNALNKTVSFNDEHEAYSTSPGPSRRHEHQKALDPSTLPGIYILAHSKEAQRLFDRIPLSWGVQYEIARGVSRGLWSWETVTQSEAALTALRGPNINASRVSQVLGRPLGDVLPSDAALWCVSDRVETSGC